MMKNQPWRHYHIEITGLGRISGTYVWRSAADSVAYALKIETHPNAVTKVVTCMDQCLPTFYCFEVAEDYIPRQVADRLFSGKNAD